MSEINIRTARPSDARQLLEIYSKYVVDTAITFEYVVPTVDEFTGRIEKTLKRYPYFVAEYENRIIGYTYAGSFRTRAAYDWSVETTIYVDSGCRKMGFGRKLYESLEIALCKQNILNANVCIAYTERADNHLTGDSVSFHMRMGYRTVGVFHQCGYKFDRWYDIICMEKHLGTHTGNQMAVKQFEEIRDAAETLIATV